MTHVDRDRRFELDGLVADAGKWRIAVAGITGREGSMVVRHMVEYGTNVVGGVTPGKGGTTSCGLPVFDLMEEAIAAVEADTVLVSVPPAAARGAVLESLDAGIRRVVVSTERIPWSDTAYVVAAADEVGAMIIGPNTTGMILPRARVKIGSIGGNRARSLFPAGRVAIVSRSGGMATEIAVMLRQAGMGISFAVAIGGDPLVGTDAASFAQLAHEDAETDAIVYWGEPGSSQEERLSTALENSEITKPLFALVGGAFIEDLPRDTSFGHAAAIVRRAADAPTAKLERFAQAGARTPRFGELSSEVAAAAAAISR